MPKLISDQVRKCVVEIASQHGFTVQLKDGVQDQYVKNLMFFCKSINQTVYIRKDRAIGDGGIPAYFNVAVHPNFFNKAWVSVPEGIEELINQQKKKNLHSSSNYQKFPVYPENDEPCGMSFKVIGYDALDKLFWQMTAGNKKLDSSSEPTVSVSSQMDTGFDLEEKLGFVEKMIAPIKPRKQIGNLPAKGLVIKSPYIDLIIAGKKTWEMRSRATNVRGQIALIKQGSSQIVGIANLVDVKGPLSKQDKLKTIDKHQISIDRLESGETDKWDTAWVLENAQPLKTPIHYQHPNGAVIWVNLDDSLQKQLAIIIN